MSQSAGGKFSTLQAGLRALRFIRHLPHFVRLYWRLLGDRRVSIWPKAVLVLGLVYVISPVDLVPELLFPVLGEIDDLIILIAACRLFIYWCPPEVVEEHVRRIAAGA